MKTLGAILALVLSISGLAFQVSTTERDNDIASIEHRRCRSQQEFAQFQKDVAALDIKWRAADSASRALLFLRAADAISSSGFDKEDLYEKYAVEQEYALTGLEHALTEKLSLDTEMKLVMHLRTDMTKAVPSSNEFAQDREHKSLLWVHAWERLEQEQLTMFSKKDMPVMNVRPPPGTGVPAGVSPDAIKDPPLRKQYEDAIQQNTIKSERFSYHVGIMHLKDAFDRTAEEFFIQSYSKGPVNLTELNEILTPIKDQDAKARIMKAIHEGGI
jgi:hypothetical protein